MSEGDDLDRIMAVMELAFDPHWQEAWTRSQVANSLTLPTTHYVLIDGYGRALVNEKPAAGFVLSRQAADEEELLLVAVRPDLRERGLGKALLSLFEKAAASRGANKLFLEMRANNPAENLYRKAGFEPIGTRKGYYRTQSGSLIDAITFSKHLPS